jgi:hypothetical protein
MAKAYIKLFGMRFDFQTATAGAAIAIFAVLVLGLLPLLLYIGFLVAQWAIFTLFAYTITGWQYIAAVILLSMVSSFFKRDK